MYVHTSKLDAWGKGKFTNVTIAYNDMLCWCSLSLDFLSQLTCKRRTWLWRSVGPGMPLTCTSVWAPAGKHKHKHSLLMTRYTIAQFNSCGQSWFSSQSSDREHHQCSEGSGCTHAPGLEEHSVCAPQVSGFHSTATVCITAS